MWRRVRGFGRVSVGFLPLLISVGRETQAKPSQRSTCEDEPRHKPIRRLAVRWNEKNGRSLNARPAHWPKTEAQESPVNRAAKARPDWDCEGGETCGRADGAVQEPAADPGALSHDDFARLGFEMIRIVLSVKHSHASPIKSEIEGFRCSHLAPLNSSAQQSVKLIGGRSGLSYDRSRHSPSALSSSHLPSTEIEPIG